MLGKNTISSVPGPYPEALRFIRNIGVFVQCSGRHRAVFDVENVDNRAPLLLDSTRIFSWTIYTKNQEVLVPMKSSAKTLWLGIINIAQAALFQCRLWVQGSHILHRRYLPGVWSLGIALLRLNEFDSITLASPKITYLMEYLKEVVCIDRIWAWEVLLKF